MGATTFYNKGTGKDAAEVFNRLTEEAQHLYGHGGYTGTIAEKHGYEEFTLPENVNIHEAKRLIYLHEDGQEEEIPEGLRTIVKRWYEIYDDKWGPALCLKDGETYHFMGWASE